MKQKIIVRATLILTTLAIVVFCLFHFKQLCKNGYCSFRYSNSSYDDIVGIISMDISFYARRNYVCPKDISELVNYQEFINSNIAKDLKYGQEDDVFLLRVDAIRYLKNNYKNLSIAIFPDGKKDSVILLCYKRHEVISNGEFIFPAPEDSFSSFYPFESSFTDENGRCCYSNVLEDEIELKMKELNMILLDTLVSQKDANTYIQRKPIIYDYSNNHLKNYIDSSEFDLSTSSHYRNIYNFLNRLAVENHLSRIITTSFDYYL